MTLSNIKLIIFDLSNTCFSLEEPSFVHDFCQKHGLNETKFDQEYQELVKKAEVDEISGIDVWKIMLEKYHIEGDPEELILEMMKLKEAYPDTLNIAKKLKESGYKVIYLTNYSRDYWKPVKEKWDMNEYFSDGTVSYEIKVRKPAPEGFKILMKKSDVKPQETIFIDDSMKNVEAAQALGIKTHQFLSAEKLKTFLSSEGVLT